MKTWVVYLDNKAEVWIVWADRLQLLEYSLMFFKGQDVVAWFARSKVAGYVERPSSAPVTADG